MKKRYVRELWQDGIMVVEVDAPTREQAEMEINHYALIYSQDGPVKIKRRRAK